MARLSKPALSPRRSSKRRTKRVQGISTPSALMINTLRFCVSRSECVLQEPLRPIDDLVLAAALLAHHTKSALAAIALAIAR